ncbi:MAG: 30S ribosome-binding factor RbfA [Rhizomicrobium sp.]
MPRRHSASSVHRSKPGARQNTRLGAKRGPSQRQLRVGELLRHALSDILSRGEVSDPELDGVSVTVTQVVPSPDMRHASVFCEPLGGKNAGPVIAALNRHKGFLRGLMGRMIALKFTPELRFIEDTSFAEAERIEGLLKSARVQADLATPDASEIDDGDGA